MTLLLKRLDIHGFKSFASPTTFAFDRGITAIIGPNGSGKSNVSEALRWVLGEQQYSNLRGRRTEDIIFAGSDRRAPLGMAEVSLTLDNSDGDLPLDFAEITISRRAYRSGESQYLINGSRVRLKDIQQLTAPLGQSHTIIGQGLVDAVLSQRPEDRRGLFEHAAGITGLRLRANEAERGLTETAGNAQRLHDILAELEPRVRSLERAARQAREYGVVRDQLRHMQRAYYGALWQDSTRRIAEAQAVLDTADGALQSVEATHQNASRDLAELRTRERRLAELQAERAETLAAHERDLANTQHQVALLDAEARSATTRRQDLSTSLQEFQRQRETSQQDRARLGNEIAELQATLVDLEADFARHEENARTSREQRAVLERELTDVGERIVRLSRSIAEAEGRLDVYAGRAASVDAERVALERQLMEEDERGQTLLTALDEVRRQRGEIDAEIERHSLKLRQLEEQQASCRDTANELQMEIDRAEREIAGLRSRLEILERTHESGDGLYAGVRALVRATHRGRLNLAGLRGTLAELIDVPARFETAIEIALGGHLQDVIVERWSDAETAIAYLKREKAGRATFQPLDSLRRPPAPRLDVDDTGILGIASDLVTYADDVAPVVEQTLNRVLIVEDLAASRRILKRSRGWTLVTLGGEITRPSGSVTGGSNTRSAGLLARERDRRTLPHTISQREAQVNKQREALFAALREGEDVEASLVDAQQQAERLRLTAREAEVQHDRLSRDLAASRQAKARIEEQFNNLDQSRADLLREEATLQAELQEHLSTRAELHEAHTALTQRLSAQQEQPDTVLAELRADIAARRERLRALQAAAERARQDESHATRAIEQQTIEIERLEAVQAGQAGRRTELETRIGELEAAITREKEAMVPLRDDRDSIAPRIAEAERELDRSIASVRDAERARDRAALDLARCQDEQVFLRERIHNDLELDDPAALVSEAGETGEHIEKEINRLRERLRRMSTVGEDVLEEHAAEAERLQFLRSQLDDVEGAAASLRAVLTDLNRKMASSFSETFTEVAGEFERTFKRLFGGGTARLSQQNEDDEPGGVDIVAQPPGKRLQGLNQLSGGERALTAVALLVAIQRVNPSPFCLLDEVDAALDESNVVRFKDELRDLATTTQFVVITHNRGTIEGADTLYGVTMGDDGVSRTVSLRLEDAIRAVEEQESTVAAS